MSEDIVVIDDFLPPKAYENLDRFILREPMEYGYRSNSRTDPHGHWSRKFSTAGRHNLADVSYLLGDNAAFAPLNSAWQLLKDTGLMGAVLIRCYLNGYTYGVDGYFHTDSNRADEHTAIIYLNDHWEPDWAGETAFLDSDGEIVRSVLPKRNRLVIFPANRMHAGRGVSRSCVVLRKTLIFKARKRRSHNFEKLSLFLRKAGATNYSHKTGTLHDHLVRTFALLESRGLEESVCFGGGLHAIYGTNAFEHKVLTPAAKSAIANEFGKDAEQLAYLFSILSRPETLESPLTLDSGAATVELRDKQRMDMPRVIFNGLRKIECANLADQNSLGRYKTLSKLW